MAGESVFWLHRRRELDLQELLFLVTRFDQLLHEHDRYPAEWNWKWDDICLTIDEEWLVIREPVRQFDPILQAISAYTHDDAFYFTYCTVTETFIYSHWRDGSRVRTLELGLVGDDGLWVVVEGTPDAWESEVFFKERSLRTALVNVGSPEAAQAISSYWQAGQIVKGQRYPNFFGGVSSLYWAVTFHYRIPVYYYQAEHEKPPEL